MAGKVFNESLAREGKLPEMDIAEATRLVERKDHRTRNGEVKQCPFCSGVSRKVKR